MSIARCLYESTHQHAALSPVFSLTIILCTVPDFNLRRKQKTHRPPCSTIGRRIDSDIGVGRNWSFEFAARSLKLARNPRESSCALSTSMLSGSKNRRRLSGEAIEEKSTGQGETQKREREKGYRQVVYLMIAPYLIRRAQKQKHRYEAMCTIGTDDEVRE